MSLSAPNYITSRYFNALRRRVFEIEKLRDSELIREESAVSVFLAVAAIEAFVNAFFQILVNEQPFQTHKNEILSDIRTSKSLHQKLTEWLPLLFSAQFDCDAGLSNRFTKLRRLRNGLTHFSSLENTFFIDHVTINGLHDISSYSSLSVDSARESLSVAEDVVEHILRLRGVAEPDLSAGLQLWTGKMRQ